MAFLKETGIKRELEITGEQIELRQSQLEELSGANTPQAEIERERLSQEIGEFEIIIEQKTEALEEQQKAQEQEQGYDFFND